MKKTGIIVAAAVLAGSVVTGCSQAAGDMTCLDYGKLPSGERTPKVLKMIEDKGLNPMSNPMASTNVANEVNAFCGTGLAILGKPATKNLDKAIKAGVKWSTYGA